MRKILKVLAFVAFVLKIVLAVFKVPVSFDLIAVGLALWVLSEIE
jgi:hypothetical protein